MNPDIAKTLKEFEYRLSVSRVPDTVPETANGSFAIVITTMFNGNRQTSSTVVKDYDSAVEMVRTLTFHLLQNVTG